MNLLVVSNVVETVVIWVEVFTVLVSVLYSIVVVEFLTLSAVVLEAVVINSVGIPPVFPESMVLAGIAVVTNEVRASVLILLDDNKEVGTIVLSEKFTKKRVPVDILVVASSVIASVLFSPDLP